MVVGVRIVMEGKELCESKAGYAIPGLNLCWAKISTWTCTDCNSGSKLIDAKLIGPLGGDVYMFIWDVYKNLFYY